MEKASKEDANYRPFDTQAETCGNCRSMNPDGTCKKVKGLVDPKHVCDLWTKR